MDITGKEYATKDIASKVGIAESTVRKYAQVLEKAGYRFTKNESGRRIFIEADILTFNEMKNISKKNGMPVDKIAQMIVYEKRSTRHEAESDTLVKIEKEQQQTSDIVQYDERYNELINKLSKLDMIDDIVGELKEVKQANKELSERIQQQERYIKESLERRDHQLMESLKQTAEMKKAITEVAAVKEKNKNGFFARLFGKK